MKEREENRIKELFHELKQEDERRAPSFARTMEAALSRNAKTRQPWRMLPVAVAATMLILVGVFVFIIFKQSATETYQAKSSSSEPVAPLAQSPPPGDIVSTPHKNESADKTEPTRSGKRRITNQRRPSPTLISDWHSPTDFLLETPGWQLLKTTPRVDESITSIKGLFREEMN